MKNWIDIASLNDIPKRGARVVKTKNGCIAVFRTIDDQVFALNDACPHKNGPLSEGIIHGTEVTCPLHNWVIDLATGEAQGDDKGKVATHEICVKDGRILLDRTRFNTMNLPASGAQYTAQQ